MFWVCGEVEGDGDMRSTRLNYNADLRFAKSVDGFWWGSGADSSRFGDQAVVEGCLSHAS